MTKFDLRMAIWAAATALALGLAACGKESPPVQATPTAEEIKSESARLNAFFAEVFERDVKRSPIFQTYLGRKDDYDKLDDISEARQDEDIALVRQDLDRLHKEFDVAKLDADATLSYKIFEHLAKDDIEGDRWRHHDYIVNQMFGWHTDIPALLITAHGVASVADAEAYISRLNAMKEFFGEVAKGLRLRAEKGVIPPQFVFPMTLEQSRNVITGHPFDNGPADSPFLEDIKTKVGALDITPQEKQRLIAAAESALKNSVKPGYDAVIAALLDIQPKATADDGVWKLPDGADFYAFQLRHYTTTNMTAEELHDLGLREVARIHQEMEAIKTKVGFKGSLQDFFKFVTSDDRFFYPNTDTGRQAYMDLTVKLLDEIKGRLDELFITKPKADVIVKRVEAFRESGSATAFYQQPAMDGSRPGIYYENLSDMRQMPKNTLPALVYHEAIPGHHMQIAIAQELQGIPEFRKVADFTAYIEGWGLYAELLPKEIGLYQDPYDDFGRLSYEIWRAARLVVDTGIHAKRWTRQQTIDYLVQNTPFPVGDITREVERYIVYPGQATAYKVGMLKFLTLREKARQELGDRFDIRAYHDTVLKGGALPLTVLEEVVNDWVAKTKAMTPAS